MGVRPGGVGGGWCAFRQFSLGWGVRGWVFFPGKKQRSVFRGLEGYNRSLFCLLMGCGGTMAEGGQEAAASLLRLNSYHIHIIYKQICILLWLLTVANGIYGCIRKAQLLQHSCRHGSQIIMAPKHRNTHDLFSCGLVWSLIGHGGMDITKRAGRKTQEQKEKKKNGQGIQQNKGKSRMIQGVVWGENVTWANILFIRAGAESMSRHVLGMLEAGAYC